MERIGQTGEEKERDGVGEQHGESVGLKFEFFKFNEGYKREDEHN